MIRTLRISAAYAVLFGLLAVGVYMAYEGWTDYSFDRDSSTWPRTTGTILSAEVVASGSPESPEFTPRVIYTYEVKGRSFENFVVSPDEDRTFRSRLAARLRTERYEPGRKVPVYYDPDAPQRSFLRRGDQGFGIFFAVVGTVITLSGLLVLYFTLGAPFTGGRKREFVDHRFNLALRAPGGWRRRKGGKDSGTRVVFVRNGVRCVINAWSSQRGSLPSAATMATARLSIIKKSTKNAKVLLRDTRVLRGHEGVLLEVTARVVGSTLGYAVFCMAHRGFGHEIIVYGGQRDLTRRRAREILLRFLDELRFPNPARSSYSALPRVREPYRSEHYGYRFVPDGDWHHWPSLAEEDPAADLGWLHGQAFALSLFPVALPKTHTPPEAITAGLLSLYDIDRSHPALQPLSHAENRFLFSYERAVNDNRYTYRLHVAIWPGMACLAALVGEPDNPAIDDVMDEVMTSLEPPPADVQGFDVAALPAPALAREASVLARSGYWLAEHARHEEAAAFFTAASERAPSVAAYLEGLLTCLCHAQRFEEALRLIEERGNTVEQTLSLSSFLPFLLSRVGRREEAIDAYARVFSKGWRNSKDAEDYIELLLDADQKDAARAALDQMQRVGDDLWVHRLKARVFRADEDCGRAVSTLQDYVDAHPGNREAKLALLDELTLGERAEEAVALAETYLNGGRSDVPILLRRGIAECRLGRFPHAKRSFEAALELDPHDMAVQNWRDHAARELGEGSNQLIRRRLAPLELPSPNDPTEAELAVFPEDTAIYADSTVVFEFLRGERLKWTTREVIRIRTARGAEELSTLLQPFDPESQEVYINEVRVRSERGETVWVGRTEDYFVKDGDAKQARNSKVVNIPVVGLAPGRTVEFIRTMQLHGAPEHFDYRRIDMGASFPVLRSLVEVRGDIESLQVRRIGPLHEERSECRLRIQATQLPPCPPEPCAPPIGTWQPTVWLSESKGSWEEVGRDYLSKIKERLRDWEPVRELAQTIVEGHDGAEARALALATWVRREMHYKLIGFGPRSWLPERVEKVVEARWGDCKGHAILFHHLMRAVGLDAHLALVSTSDMGWPEAPSPWQFDHMINYCPDLGGGRFIDCVDKGLGWRAPVPTGLDRHSALVLDPASPRLVTIPPLGDDDNVIEMDREVTCEPGGTLGVKEVLRTHGNVAADLRRWLTSIPVNGRSQNVAAWLQHMDSRVAFEGVAFANLEELNEPLTLHISYRVPRALEELDGRLVGVPPAPFERYFLVPPICPHRRAPVEISMPYLVRSRSRIRPADPHRTVAARVAAEAAGEDAFIRWSRRLGNLDGAVEIEGEIATLRGRHPSEQYEAFRASMCEAVGALEVRLIIT